MQIRSGPDVAVSVAFSDATLHFLFEQGINNPSVGILLFLFSITSGKLTEACFVFGGVGFRHWGFMITTGVLMSEYGCKVLPMDMAI
jgi:hypothetical protein